MTADKGRTFAGPTRKLHRGNIAECLRRYEAARAMPIGTDADAMRQREECRSYAVEFIEALRHGGLLARIGDA